MTGGSAFGLAAADGVVRWLEERERGHWTPAGVVPLVPTAVIFDLRTGDPSRGPVTDDGYAACEAAAPDGRAGQRRRRPGAAVGKLFGRERAVKGGVGLAAQELPQGPRMTALAVVNALGDVIGEDGARARRRARRGRAASSRTAAFIRSAPAGAAPRGPEEPATRRRSSACSPTRR